ALSGLMAALGGLVSIGRSGICNGSNATQPFDTDAIAACIIGAVLIDVTRERMEAKARRLAAK
ncbi:ABC transporter permease, partial [Clostridiaceae bacterium]|nr:ABC transporter permease [Clostridiaceae bacterium]